MSTRNFTAGLILASLSFVTVSVGLAGAAQAAEPVKSSKTATAIGNDIAGISLGETLDSAKEKMLKANPNLTIISIPDRVGGVFGIFAQEVKNPQHITEDNVKEEFFIVPTADNKVASISRYIALDEKSAFTRNQLIKALSEKYGPNSKGSMFNEKTANRFMWAYHDDGKLLPMYAGACSNSNFTRSVGFVTVDDRPYYSNGKYISSYGGNCKLMLDVQFTVGDLEVVKNYTVSLGDVKQLYTEAKAAEKARTDAVAAKKAAIEKAAEESGGPKL